MYDYCLEIGAQQVPYFRTEEFSAVMTENEQMMLQLSNAPKGARTIFLTGSGTAAMEAVVVNLFDRQDQLLVINGGSFGARFAQICAIHSIPYTEVIPEQFGQVTYTMLQQYAGKGYTGLLVNIGETSTGVLYDMDGISRFCKENDLFLVGDAISAFLADHVDMKQWEMDVMITSSQKALACAPGISVIVLSEGALEKMKRIPQNTLYFDLRTALVNGDRGQTPFTPAVGILLQMHERLRRLCQAGLEGENIRIAEQADDFRKKLIRFDLPLKMATKYPSNAVTALCPMNEGISAYDIFLLLKDEYDIWICPNGGALADKVFRVGHMGALTVEDNDKLITALLDLQKRGKL